MIKAVDLKDGTERIIDEGLIKRQKKLMSLMRTMTTLLKSNMREDRKR